MTSPKNTNVFCHHCKKYFREYNEVSGIHGLRYITEKRTTFEKIFWIFVMVVASSGCIYMIYEIMYKYENSPVVVSFATEDTPLYQIPFPAVTICPEAKYSRNHFDYSKVFFQLMNNTKVRDEDLQIFHYLRLLCIQTPNFTDTNFEVAIKDKFFNVIDQIKPNEAEMLLSCYFMNKELQSCKNLLTPVLTDQGICYSFNIISRQEIFKDNVFHYKEYHKVTNQSKSYFNSDYGYFDNVGANTYPRRALEAGADNSLTIFLRYNANESDFICNSFLQGFRVLIHSPWDIPRLTKNYIRIPFDKVVEIAMQPDLVTTSATVIKFNPEKRKCYMNNERYLKYFREYNQYNCLFECITNYTLSKCGCVQFFMPSELKVKELELSLIGKSFCDCKPSCTNLEFNVETSHSDFYYKEFFETFPTNITVQNNGSHWSILQIYFKHSYFMSRQRDELYGISDLISNLGGILGLFTGFSLISVIEILYFCSFRPFFNKRIYGVWSGSEG